MWVAGAPAQAAPEYTEAERATRAARAAACPVARGQPDRSEYDEWGRHKDYVEPVKSDDGLGGSIHGSTDEMLGVDEPEDDTSSLDLSDTEIEPRQRPAPPELTEEQVASRGLTNGEASGGKRPANPPPTDLAVRSRGRPWISSGPTGGTRSKHRLPSTSRSPRSDLYVGCATHRPPATSSRASWTAAFTTSTSRRPRCATSA